MSNLEILQKLSLGVEDTTEITINVDGKNEKFTIRPLTSGELMKLQSIEKKPYSMSMNIDTSGKARDIKKNGESTMDIGMAEFTEAQAKTVFTAVAWSLSNNDETITPEDIESLPAGVPEEIFKHVIDISKLSDSDLTIIKQFRN